MTLWQYNAQHQVKTVRRAAGTADETLTYYSYDLKGDLVGIDPPDAFPTPASAIYDPANGRYPTAASDYHSEYRIQLEYGHYDCDAGTGYVPTATSAYEGRVTRIRYSDGSGTYYGYDAAGDLAWIKNATLPVYATITRDALHRPAILNVYPVATDPATRVEETIAYDEFGRTASWEYANYVGSANQTALYYNLTYTYDPLSRIESETKTDAAGATIDRWTASYAFDAANGRWTSTVTKSAGGSSYAYVYKEDPKGRLAEIDNPFGQAFGFHYDRNGNLTAKLFPNGETDAYSYDARDRISAIAYGGPGRSLTYGRDATGRITQETNDASHTAEDRTFGYDNLGRLIAEGWPGESPARSYAYAYDKSGNRQSKTVAGASSYTDYYGYDFAHSDPDQLTRTRAASRRTDYSRTRSG